jgi:hypothetical protein
MCHDLLSVEGYRQHLTWSRMVNVCDLHKCRFAPLSLTCLGQKKMLTFFANSTF